ncbi:hypothetical protein QE152_g34458 [Popillia japonica]|uniref:Integrase catalytic domain-containing protein n=1 Tax=Popillia japonica TaxID=7064 RepID=A0AAW1ITQ9_POPJA
MNIKHVLNATATPRANGQVERYNPSLSASTDDEERWDMEVERYNRTILASLSASTDDEERWDMVVSRVRWGLNSTKNSSTEKSPYELLFGYEPRGVAESVLSNEIATEPIEERDLSAIRKQAKKVIDAKQGERKSKFDAHRYAGYEYKVGDQVMVRTQRPRSLYVITNVLDHDRYVVKDVEGSSRSQRRYSGIVSLDKLKAFNVEVSSESDVESDTNEIEA